MANHKALPGYKARTTKRGYRVVEIDAWADPARDESWLAEARRRSPTESDFQREVLRSWETVQGDAYFDPRGPLSKEWRDGDSVWSLVAEDRLNRALSRIRKLDERGELETYVARNDAPRTHIGQVTVVFASRR